jgi:hypothetical protein
LLCKTLYYIVVDGEVVANLAKILQLCPAVTVESPSIVNGTKQHGVVQKAPNVEIMSFDIGMNLETIAGKKAVLRLGLVLPGIGLLVNPVFQ